jgi:hypothetical protein
MGRGHLNWQYIQALQTKLRHGSVRLHFLDNASQTRRVGHVAVMQKERFALFVHVMEQVIDPRRVEQGAAALDAMHFITLIQQQFCEIGPVLPRDTRDQCDFFNLTHFNNFLFCGYLP